MTPSLSAWPPVLYVIADIKQGGAAGENAARVAEAIRKELSPAQLTLLFQLRDKTASALTLFEAASSWVKALLPHQAFFLINERTDVAIATGAAGVHLGTGSYPVGAARELLPEGLVAWSAHSVAEAAEAGAKGCDLVTLSPIYESPGKGMPLGTGPLADAARELRGTPLLALGGVTRARLPDVARSGASGVAVIGAVWSAPDPAAAARELALEIAKCWENRTDAGAKNG